MKYRIEYLPQAIEDLQAIEDWYRLNFDDRTALRVSNSIVDTILRLEEFPNSGSIPSDEWMEQQGFRLVIAGRHVAIYTQEMNILYIHHIADTRTEYNKLFHV